MDELREQRRQNETLYMNAWRAELACRQAGDEHGQRTQHAIMEDCDRRINELEHLERGAHEAARLARDCPPLYDALVRSIRGC